MTSLPRHATICFAIAFVGTALSCASTKKLAPSTPHTSESDWRDHQAQLDDLESSFTCYFEGPPGGTPPEKVRGSEAFTSDELSLMATVYRKLVLGSVFWHRFDPCQPTRYEMTVWVSGWVDDVVSPPQEFFDEITSDTIRIVAPGGLKQSVPKCELKLLSWIAPDSAYVDVLVWHFGSGVGRSALAVRDGNDWKICPMRAFVTHSGS